MIRNCLFALLFSGLGLVGCASSAGSRVTVLNETPASMLVSAREVSSGAAVASLDGVVMAPVTSGGFEVPAGQASESMVVSVSIATDSGDPVGGALVAPLEPPGPWLVRIQRNAEGRMVVVVDKDRGARELDREPPRDLRERGFNSDQPPRNPSFR